MPKISIIIPVYNVEQYLEKSLNSVVNQSMDDIEIIIVDDGSPDKSYEIYNRFAKKDQRIKIIKKENHVRRCFRGTKYRNRKCNR